MNKKRYVWLIIVLATTFIFLSPNLNNGLLNWDDPIYITNNSLIKDNSFNGVKNIFFTKEVVGNYSPLVLMSWSLDYTVSNLNPFTFHLSNILYHLIVVALVFYLTMLLSKRTEVAFITSMLFGIHPMHVEAVGWITARKDLIYSLFFIAGLIVYYFYIDKRNKRSKRYLYLGCLMFYILSLLSKGTAVIFPLVLFLLDYLKQRGNLKRIILEKIPFFLLSVLFLFIAIEGHTLEGALENAVQTSFLNSFFVGFYGYLNYIVKAIIPFNLSGYHPYPNIIDNQFPWYFYASAIPILTIFIISIVKAKKHRYLVFGVAFFFVTLIPVIQVLPLGNALIADRFTYLPYFGLFFLFAMLVIRLLDSYKSFKTPIRIAIIVCFFILGIMSFQYSKTFENSNTFWSNVIAIYPNDYLAYLNRGTYKIQQQKNLEAISDFNKGIDLNPQDYSLVYNRGLAHKYIGEYQKAINDYTLSISLNSSYSSNYLNRGIAFSDLKKYDRSIKDFDKVIELEPENYKAYYNRAMALKNKGVFEKAIQDLSKVISLKKVLPLALTNRGELFSIVNQQELALKDFNRVIQTNPKMTIAYIKRGLLYLNKKDFDLAEKDFEAVLQLNNSIIEAHINLGVIAMNRQQYNKAIKYFDTAQKLNPNNYIVYYNRGLLQLLTKNYTIAIEEFNKCLRLNPNFIMAKKDIETAIKLSQEM